MTETDLSRNAMFRICKKAGAPRVSETAARELTNTLEEIGAKIAKDALQYAIHAGRKTIKTEDIDIAVRKFLQK